MRGEAFESVRASSESFDEDAKVGFKLEEHRWVPHRANARDGGSDEEDVRVLLESDPGCGWRGGRRGILGEGRRETMRVLTVGRGGGRKEGCRERFCRMYMSAGSSPSTYGDAFSRSRMKT